MYRKLFYLVLALGLSFNLVSCSSSGKSVGSLEGIGHFSFEVLEQINQLEAKELVGFFATTNDINKCLSETVKGEKTKNSLYSLIEDEQSERPQYLYKSIYNTKREAAMLGIEWNKVIYLDYVIPYRQSEPPYKGELFLKYGESVYSVGVESMNIGDNYYLTNLSGIRKVSR